MRQRQVYIDVLRGGVMLLVVYWHIICFSVGIGERSNLTKFFLSFYLMTFFFISGFVGHKSVSQGCQAISRFVIKKASTLLVPAFVSLGVFCFLAGRSYLTALSEGSKSGYWFTMALFEMFAILGGCSCLLAKIGDVRVKSGVLLLLALTVYVLHKFVFAIPVGLSEYLCLGYLTFYFPVFLFGVVCGMNAELFHAVLGCKYVPLALAILTLIGLTVGFIPNYLLRVCSTLLVYFVVWKVVSVQMESGLKKCVVNFLSIVGQNTIQIYFLHYFLIFRVPEPVVEYIAGLYHDKCFLIHSSAGFVEFVLVGVLSLLVSYCCIVMGRLLNTVPGIGRLMFGK